MILRARCVATPSDSLIDNGSVVVKDGLIHWAGRWRDCDATGQDIRDLGEVALMPGLINAHAHLDYTSMAGQIPAPRYFPDWIKTILSFKAHWSCSEFAESWLKGARMLLETGTTTVGDIESAPELLEQFWQATPLRVISFLEMTGVKSRRAPAEILDEALRRMDSLPRLPRKECGLSPHALYSTAPELLRLSATVARERGLLLCTHLAESESEFQMFQDARGPFYDWLQSQRGMDDCGGTSPVRRAHQSALLSDRFLAVHANYLAPGDEELLSRAGASVVHCPRSHEYFGHDPFPLERLRAAGVNVCLGTDSLASTRKQGGKNPELNPWEEMRAFATAHPGVAPREIVDMATTRAARALRKEAEIGEVRPDFAADLIGVTYSGPAQENRFFEELLYAGTVREVFIAGELVRVV